jgi:hypothetical protein
MLCDEESSNIRKWKLPFRERRGNLGLNSCVGTDDVSRYKCNSVQVKFTWTIDAIEISAEKVPYCTVKSKAVTYGLSCTVRQGAGVVALWLVVDVDSPRADMRFRSISIASKEFIRMNLPPFAADEQSAVRMNHFGSTNRAPVSCCVALRTKTPECLQVPIQNQFDLACCCIVASHLVPTCTLVRFVPEFPTDLHTIGL